MLDDLKYIDHKDAQDALGVAAKQWQQLRQDYDLNWSYPKSIDQVIVAGMGGSALAAALASSWPGLKVPFQIVRDYDLPSYASDNTLVVLSSYSGNTEETLSVLAAAKAQNCLIVTIAAGGKLLDQAKSESYPYCQLPSGLQPRMATFSNLAALVQIFEAAGVIEPGSLDELRLAADWLQGELDQWLPTVATSNNPAKQLALELAGKSPVVYAGSILAPAAYKWKISFNENAKNVAWCGVLPEFNHNEFLGWSSHPPQKPYAVIDLLSSFDHPQVKKRFEIGDRLLSGQRPAAHKIEAGGETILQQLLWTVVLGDFVSLYLALLNGLNPTPVDLIEKLKLALVD